MEIVIDTSALISVIAGEPERKRIIELTAGNALIGPGSISWEIGNAFIDTGSKADGIRPKFQPQDPGGLKCKFIPILKHGKSLP